MTNYVNEAIRFSIIFPIYNVEPYLKQAIELILQQTYHNFQLILVDDCATDGCPKICDAYAKKYDNVSVIHFPENRGVSMARNAGIERADGDYILFLDPDDMYETNMLETIAAAVENNMVDVVVYSFTEDYYNQKEVLEYSIDRVMPAKVYEHKNEIHKLVADLEANTMYGYPWNKAYNARFLYESGASFEVVPHIEDILFNISFFQNVSSVVMLSDQLYHYRNHVNARLTSRYFSDYFKVQKRRIQEFLDQQKSWGSCNEKVMSNMSGVYFRSFLSYMQRELEHGSSRKEVETLARQEMTSQMYEMLKEHMNATNKMARWIYRPLAQGKVRRAIGLTAVISFVKKHFPFLYAKLKQNR